MSVPRLMLVPTHATGLANALAAAMAEIFTAQGRRVRYHHLGPLVPAAAWDRWEGAAFLDLQLYDQESALALYDVATRGADLSLLSSSTGVLDRREGADWEPARAAALLDCPVVVVLDCRGWEVGIRALVRGLKAELSEVDLAGVLLSGVLDEEHAGLLRAALRVQGVPVVGCLREGYGLAWEASPPGPWGLPLGGGLLEAVSTQIDLGELESIAGQRGFLAPQNWLNDRGGGGPLVMVSGCRGFTPWSRDSIEILRAAGARVRRLDLLKDRSLPHEASGLLLAGTIWPADLPALAGNHSLLADVRSRIEEGLPTVALGGGMAYLLEKVQDSLGRTLEMAGVIPQPGEILWDLESPAYLEVRGQRDSLLLSAGDVCSGWISTEFELPVPTPEGSAPFGLVAAGSSQGLPDGTMTDTLVCSRAFVHLASSAERGERFVRSCGRYASGHNLRLSG